MKSSMCSIIIPTYNHGKYLERSISCSLSQTYKNIEVIVIDDGSTDDTSEIIKKFVKSIIYHKKINGGLGAARNTGIEISNGEYIQFLDADDYIDLSKIEKQIAVFKADPSLAVVYSDCSCSDTNGSDISNVSYELMRNEDPIPVLLKRSLFPVHAALILRSAIIEAGKFDESRIAQEDWQLWLVISLNRQKFKYLPENLAHYDQGGSTMINNPILMFKRTRHMMETFLAKPLFTLFKSTGKENLNSFIANQSLLLATRAYNNGWWEISRKYFLIAIRSAPKQIPFKYWLCVPKTFLRRFHNFIRGKKIIIPEGVN